MQLEKGEHRFLAVLESYSDAEATVIIQKAGQKVTLSLEVANSDEIEIAEQSHDTTISFKSGKKIIVCETYSEIIAKVIEYKRNCQLKLPEIE